ncbi:hypothetical protein ACQJBY_016244 [Aegilops geniculata]
MDPEAVRRTLEPTASAADISGSTPYDSFVISGVRLEAAEHGRVLCSFVVTPRIASPQGFLLSGVTATLADQLGSAVFFSSGVGTSGVSLEISVSYVDTAAVGCMAVVARVDASKSLIGIGYAGLVAWRSTASALVW